MSEQTKTASEIVCKQLTDRTSDDFNRCLQVLHQGFIDAPLHILTGGGNLELTQMRDRAALEASLLDCEVWTASIDGAIGSLCIVAPPGKSVNKGPGKEALFAEFHSLFPKELAEWQTTVMAPLMKARTERFKELNTGPTYHLNKIVTDPAHRRQGLASALLDLLVNRLDKEEASFTLLTESEGNAKFYRRFGFETVYEATLTYPDGTTGPLIGMLRLPQKPTES